MPEIYHRLNEIFSLFPMSWEFSKNLLLLITRAIPWSLYNSNARIIEKKIVRIIESSNDGKLKLVKCIRVKFVFEKSILEIS